MKKLLFLTVIGTALVFASTGAELVKAKNKGLSLKLQKPKTLFKEIS